MAVYGYHRTSTRDQHLDRGIQEIQVFCKEHALELVNIFTDQQTGKNFDRPRYMVLVEDVLREGDILLVTELDRLGRNKRDTMELYASISEIQKKEKRQKEGIAMKKLRGEWDDYGRPPAIKEEQFDEAYKRVTAGEITQAELKQELGLSHTTFYRYRKKYFQKYPEIFQSAE